jgi:hypothetical protein
VGNDSASMMGGCYPSGGITLGPAMTFGYLAGLSLAQARPAVAQATHNFHSQGQCNDTV